LDTVAWVWIYNRIWLQLSAEVSMETFRSLLPIPSKHRKSC